MTERYFREELATLKAIAAQFAQQYPAVAPMLAGGTADPDVERLFEGVAFQIGLFRRKLEDNIPEFLQDLACLTAPHYLRPIPATTVVAFAPRPTLARSLTIPSGSELASVSVEGTTCVFRTCGDLEIHPLELTDAAFQQPPGEPPSVVLSFTLTGSTLSEWSPGSVRFFLAGHFSAAADLYLLLRRHLQRIVMMPEGEGTGIALPPEFLRPWGFAPEDAVIPFPTQVFPGYRLLQEYFAIPHRFFFFDLTGWDRWVDRGHGSRFAVRFELSPFSLPQPRLGRESVVLSATPAINLFHADATPVAVDHRSESYLLSPQGMPADHVQIFSVDEVRETSTNGSGRRIPPFDRCNRSDRGTPCYRVTVSKRPVDTGVDVHLSLLYPKECFPERETLSVALTCSNGTLAETLRVGDLCRTRETSPEGATFRNITPVTPTVMPPFEKDLLWHLVSHLALNRLSIANAPNLRALLSLYLFDAGNRDRQGVAVNRNHIEGIEEVEICPGDRLVRGVPMRGTDVRMLVRGDHFAGPGDLFLFGSVLDDFLGGYGALNTWTRLTLQDLTTGEIMQWQPRLGMKPLL